MQSVRASLLALLSACAFAMPAPAQVERTERSGHVSAYQWEDSAAKPRAVVVAIHGVSMHGAVYDSMARELAADGVVVVAPDLRGYGRWMKFGAKKEGRLNYDRSYEDVTQLVKDCREKFPGVPVYALGESLGAGMALHVASERPDLVDGVILSSPALRRQLLLKSIVSEMFSTNNIKGPSRNVNMRTYIQKFASEDPNVTQAALDDPLVRKHLSVLDLLRTVRCIRPNLKYARQLPADMPILVLQGGRDRILKGKAVNELLASVKSTDQTVQWFNNRGHLLLETAYVKEDTLNSVTNWLDAHIGNSRTVTAEQIPTLTSSAAHSSQPVISTREDL